MGMKKTFGIWLSLSKKDNQVLDLIIQDLSNQLVDGNIFIPHLSITAAKLTFDEGVELIDKYTEGFEPLEVEMEEVSYSENRSKTLFIQIKPSEHLNKLKSAFGNHLGDFEFNPHISLMYKTGIDSAVKEEIVSDLIIPKSFTCTSCVLIGPNNLGNWDDYSKWEVVYEKVFSGDSLEQS